MSRRESNAVRRVGLLFRLFLFFVLIPLIMASVRAHERKKIPVPNKVFEELSKADFIKECLSRVHPEEILEAESIKLSKRASPQLLVKGRGCLCGASNCPVWIYRKGGSRYELILDGDSVVDVKPGTSATRGYRDLILFKHGSAFDTYIYHYKFDGRKYRVTDCFERHYRNSRGGFDGKLGAKTIRTKCD